MLPVNLLELLLREADAVPAMTDPWTSDSRPSRTRARDDRRTPRTPPHEACAPNRSTAEPSAASDPRGPLAELPLFYNPPYEDPAHDALAWHLVHHLAPATCALQHRAVVLTPDDCFRVDFLIECDEEAYGSRRIGILCGGSDEDYAPPLGEPALREALLMGADAVDVLYRFRREDLTPERLDDVLHLVAKWDPALFGRQGRQRLRQNASSEARHATVHPATAEVRLSYAPEPVDVEEGEIPKRPADAGELVVKRLSRLHPAAWREAYARVMDAPGYPGERAWRKSA